MSSSIRGIPFSISPSMASWRSDPYVFLVLYILDFFFFVCVYYGYIWNGFCSFGSTFQVAATRAAAEDAYHVVRKGFVFLAFSAKLVSISIFLYWFYGVAFDSVGTISTHNFENTVSISCFRLKLWSLPVYGFWEWMLKFSFWECL